MPKRKQPLVLSEVDRHYLEGLLKKGQMKARAYKRVLGLLELDRDLPMNEIAKSLKVARSTLTKWEKRYHLEGLTMLEEKARSGRPMVISGEQRAKVTALACSTPPEGHSRWTLRLLADKAVELDYCDHICHTHVSQILKKTN